jgi:hypothetical protein
MNNVYNIYDYWPKVFGPKEFNKLNGGKIISFVVLCEAFVFFFPASFTRWHNLDLLPNLNSLKICAIQ